MESGLIQPGQRVRVTQRVPRQTGDLLATVEGEVIRVTRSKTGSWYAHAPDHKLWLERLELRKDNGETAVINVDRWTRIELLGAAAAAAELSERRG